MKRIKLLQNIFAAFLLLVAMGASAQQVSISGNVTESESGDPSINATVSIKGKVAGTITDIDGNFTLKTNVAVPFTIIISGVGVESQEVEITQDGQVVNAVLETKTFELPGGDLVVSASRVEEKIMESPVTVEKLDNIAIRQSSTTDYYDELSKLKGVHTSQGSLTFTAINTRGFASIANTRFVQLMDGMDNAAPLLNFPTGNIVGISELDIQNIELVPGAASALYGPNAFNGILLMNSKSPFDFQGLSVMVKAGMTSSQGDDNPLASTRYPQQYMRSFKPTAPMVNAAIRYAKAFNNKFAFKLNFAYLTAQDWPSNDYSTDRVWSRRDSSYVNARNFDGMNIYGDEVQIALTRDLNNQPGIDTTVLVTRTGWREEDILDKRAATSLKADASFHYRINDNIEAIASYRIGSGNSVYQGSERYALRNFIQQFAKLEFKGSNFFVRAYGSFTDDGDSYNMTALGSYMNEAIMPTAAYDTLFGAVPGGWAVAYNFAYGSPDNAFGVENGLQGLLNAALTSQNVIGPNGQPLVLDGSDYSARAFADMGGFGLVNNDPTWYPILRSAIKGSIMGNIQGQTPATYDYLVDHLLGYSSGNGRPAVGSAEYNTIMETIRGGLFQRGGAGFIDASRLWHAEGQYDFTHLTKDIIELQVGGNFRRYSLWTDGTVFNEDPSGTGTNGRIGINEYGAYIQATKRFVNDRIRITASYRYDKNQNFKGRFTPRVAAVFTLGDKRQHNIRMSFQTGFRNPDTQAQYIYFPTSVTLLGGSTGNNTDSLGNSRYHVYGEPVITETSWNAYRAGLITQAQIDTITVDYIKPEKLTAFELGYKALLAGRVFIDVSGYYNIYRDFQSQINVRNTTPATHRGNLVGLDGSGYTTWRAYTNQPDTLYSWGASIGTAIKLVKGFTLSGNYSFADYSVNAQSLANGFQPGFNTPKNRFNWGLEQRDELLKNFGFNITYRWQQSFYWENSFGSGVVPSYGQLDAQINYTIRSLKTIVKIGCSNIIGPEFNTNTGGPFVGRMPFISLVYDQGMRK